MIWSFGPVQNDLYIRFKMTCTAQNDFGPIEKQGTSKLKALRL